MPSPATVSLVIGGDTLVVPYLVGGSTYYTGERKLLVYVDPVNGSDLNTGGITDPVQSLYYAVEIAHEGGVVLMAAGSYGGLALSNRRVKLTAMKGASPVLSTIQIANGTLEVDGISFTHGIYSYNTSKVSGSAFIRNCVFANKSFLRFRKVKYVSIFRNEISTVTEGIDVEDCTEAGIGSNVILGTTTPVRISKTARLDFFNNSVEDCGVVYLDGTPSPQNYSIAYVLVTDFIRTSARVTFPVSSISYAAINVCEGATQGEVSDFTILGGTIYWAGTDLEDRLQTGDTLRILYVSQEADVDRWRLDSNNLTDIASGFDIVTGGTVEFRNNNFWQTTPPVPLTLGNISEDPLYQAPDNLRLQAGSPDLDAAFSTRWSSVVNRIVPYDQYIDRDRARRFHVQTGYNPDIGAYESLTGTNVHSGVDWYMGERGYDYVHSGDLPNPLLSLSQSFDNSSDSPIKVVLPEPLDNVSSRHDTVVESVVDLNSSSVTIHDPQINDVENIVKVDQVSIRPWLPVYDPSTSAFVSDQGDDDTGDGSQGNPYRTVTKALSTAAVNVYVEAGIYPVFVGVPGKRIIPISKTITINTGGYSTSHTESKLWTNNSDNTRVKFFSTKITFNHD